MRPEILLTSLFFTSQAPSTLLCNRTRATYYRLMVKITGMGTGFRYQNPNTEDLSYLMEGLILGQTVEAHLIAANENPSSILGFGEQGTTFGYPNDQQITAKLDELIALLRWV